MTPSTLSAWMTRLGYNKLEAAEALGIARTTLDRYLSGRTIPRVVALACYALEFSQHNYDDDGIANFYETATPEMFWR
jgi:transcriptional regulator with XRE-family HTH domain